ncbi:MFS transporter, partial [Methylobacterium sp. A54F]
VGAKQSVPWGRVTKRILPVTLTYFCYGWTLWLFLGWLPTFFKQSYGLDLKNSALFASGVFFAGVVGDTLGGVLSDGILKRTGNLKLARLSIIVVGFLGAAVSL